MMMMTSQIWSPERHSRTRSNKGIAIRAVEDLGHGRRHGAMIWGILRTLGPCHGCQHEHGDICGSLGLLACTKSYSAFLFSPSIRSKIVRPGRLISTQIRVT